MKNRFSRIKDKLLGLFSIPIFAQSTHIYSDTANKPVLKFDKWGNFKLVQFADLQDGANIDARTLELMNNVLDRERPDLVILSGDNIDGKSNTADEVKKAISNIAEPMETRNIPWAIVFGNHDDEHCIMTKEDMMRFYMSFSCNISQIGCKTFGRIGNYNLLVQGTTSDSPAFNIYMLDSGKYSIFSKYHYITKSQINWYKDTADRLKARYRKIIPSLMFFHIPLPEFKTAYKAAHIDGGRLESESTPLINSGLFNTAVKTGDVKGIFVGHDHINTYTAILKGVRLGYGGSAGYAEYGSKDLQKGARVFEIREDNPSEFTTRMIFEGEASLKYEIIA